MLSLCINHFISHVSAYIFIKIFLIYQSVPLFNLPILPIKRGHLTAI